MRFRQAVTLEPWGGISFGERWALDVSTAVMWLLSRDQRITVLVNLLAEQVDNEDQVDAIADMLRMKLRLADHAPLSG